MILISAGVFKITWRSQLITTYFSAETFSARSTIFSMTPAEFQLLFPPAACHQFRPICQTCDSTQSAAWSDPYRLECDVAPSPPDRHPVDKVQSHQYHRCPFALAG